MKYRAGLLLGLVALLVAIFAYHAYQYAVDSPYRISVKEAKSLLLKDEVDLILDVRTDVERATLGYFPGSVHIPSSDLDRRMPQEYPNKNIRILAYCNTGHRARMATDKLRTLGYHNAVYISSTYTSLY
jgi:rhodanese-related sulfurtransferase